MINSILELNKFIASEGVKTQSQILPRLIEKQELISAKLAKLIIERETKTSFPVSPA